MSEEKNPTTAGYVARYLQGALKDRTAGAVTPDGQPVHHYGAGHIGPTLWADAPWRLEPGRQEIPFTFIVRDAEKDTVKMRLKEIAVWEAPDDGVPWKDKDWQLVHRFTAGLGKITQQFWTYRPAPSIPLGRPPTIPLSSFKTAGPGQRLLLKVVFKGSRLRPIMGRRSFEEWRPLAVLLASKPLPLRDTSQWYYGDTHYHSDYTNDVKEFGNPVPDTRAAAECIGLDWLVITDHSVDLADENPYWENKLTETRWGDLGLEVRANSDESVRLLRGEEITLLGQPGKGDDTLHLLAFGSDFDELIPGAFAKESLLAEVASLLPLFSKDLYAHLFGPIYRLEEVLSGVDQSGKAVPALKGRSVRAQGALAFAAHPASFAQAPGGTWDFYDLAQPIHGMEAWNTRIRFHAGKEESPFDHWEEGKDWKEGASKRGIEVWDRFLRQKVGLDDPRFILLAGSDAHGAFNYSEGWWVDWDGMRADDNSLGKVRTLLYLPHRDPESPRRAPTEAEVAEAVRAGSCVVTDGPALNFTLSFNGDQAKLGEIITVEGNGALEIGIQAASTDEFGQVERVRVVYYFLGMDRSVSELVDYPVGDSTVVNDDLPSGPGYVRLEAMTNDGQDTFRCFTNPIWIKVAGPGKRQLCVNGVDH